jgi:hypothetical protein
MVLPKPLLDKVTMISSNFQRYNKLTLGKLTLISLLIWGLEILWTYILLLSQNINVGLIAAISLVTVINLSFVFPSPPGYLGVYDFFIVMVLTFWGVPKTQALTFALYEHGLEYILLSFLGCYSAYKISFNPFDTQNWINNKTKRPFNGGYR